MKIAIAIALATLSLATPAEAQYYYARVGYRCVAYERTYYGPRKFICPSPPRRVGARCACQAPGYAYGVNIYGRQVP